MIVKLLYKYLRHDVEQLTHRYAQSRLSDAPEKADMAELGKNQSDNELIVRFVVTGTAHLRRILREYLDNKTEDANDKLPTDKTEWGFKFKTEIMDSHGLAELMHWFIVRWCVWQWCNAFSPNDSGLAKAELDDMEEDIKNVMLDAAMPIKERRDTYIDEDDVVIEYCPEDETY